MTANGTRSSMWPWASLAASGPTTAAMPQLRLTRPITAPRPTPADAAPLPASRYEKVFSPARPAAEASRTAAIATVERSATGTSQAAP